MSRDPDADERAGPAVGPGGPPVVFFVAGDGSQTTAWRELAIVFAGSFIAGSAVIRAPAAGVGIALVASALWLLLKARWTPRGPARCCSNPECLHDLAGGEPACPGCGGVILGTIRSIDERHEAAARLRALKVIPPARDRPPER